jgi:hypothetical protein
MPQTKLKSSHIMTIGAKVLAILVVPKGCIAGQLISTKLQKDVQVPRAGGLSRGAIKRQRGRVGC